MTAGICFFLCMLHAHCIHSKANHYELGEKNNLCLKALLCVHAHMAGSQQQLTDSLGCIDTLKNIHTQTKPGHMKPNHQINENGYFDWVSRNLRNKACSALRTLPLFFSCSCLPLEIHLQSKGKTFRLSVAKYRSNLEGCKWLHCEALKGNKEEKSRRARGSWRLMTLVHWQLEVTKRKEKRGRHWADFLLLKDRPVLWTVMASFSQASTQTEINRDCCKDTLRDKVELLWPGALLRCTRQQVFYYVNVSLHTTLFYCTTSRVQYSQTHMLPLTLFTWQKFCTDTPGVIIYLENWHKLDFHMYWRKFKKCFNTLLFICVG